MVNGMKIENIPLFIAFFVLILFVVFGQKFLAEYFFAKMSEALSNDDFVSFDKYANNFFSRFLFSPFELNYMKLNAAFLRDDKKHTDAVIRDFELIDMRENQKEDVYMRIFNYYMAEKNYPKAKFYMEKIDKEIKNPSIKEECKMIYDIYACKSSNHLNKLLEDLKDQPVEQRGYTEMLISDSYQNMGDKKNAKKYKDLSLNHFKMLEEKIRKQGTKGGQKGK